MRTREERINAIRDQRIRGLVIVGLVILGFLVPLPKAMAGTIEAVTDQSIVIEQPEVELANPYVLGLPRNVATKLAKYRLYRAMLAEAINENIEMSVRDEIRSKLVIARRSTLSSLPHYDLTEDASIYYALALVEDPEQSRSHYAKALGVIRDLMSRPMSRDNEQFIGQLKSFIMDRISHDKMKS
jgi:hypothetical protein